MLTIFQLWDVPAAHKQYMDEINIGERSRNDPEAATKMFQDSLDLAEKLAREADLFKFAPSLGSDNPQMHVRSWKPALLDLSMTPGGWTAAFLKYQRFGKVFATATHENGK